ncbi:MAG: segregation/condensation protein A [Chloroflexi bacterium]|nr:segregation/condensation protein A [Chloroflexota bacterium]
MPGIGATGQFIDARPADMYSFRLPETGFEGPLDLLLHLIEHRELDVTRISLAAVADQFLEIVSLPGAIELSALADYLVIAAKLILIKSRLLLPKASSPADEDEQDLGDALVKQLREYKMFKQVAAFLRERERQGLHAYPRFSPPPRPQPATWRLEGVTVSDLAMALHRALNLRPTLPQGTLTVPLSVSIDEQIRDIAEMVKRRTRVRFSHLLHAARTRVHVLVTFLAVLEMIKRRQIDARQDKLFGEIVLMRRSETPVEALYPDEDLEIDYTT